MVNNDAKSEAQGVRANQEDGSPSPDRHRSRRTGQDSGRSESQPVSIGGADRQGRNLSGQQGGTIAGGIIRQSIDETQYELEEAERKVNRLKDKLRQLKQLLNELYRKTGESS